MLNNTHNSHFINHLLLIVGGNGAWYRACVRAQTIKLLVIYELHVDEHIAGFISQDTYLLLHGCL